MPTLPNVLFVVADLRLGGLERLVADWSLALHPGIARCSVLCLRARCGPLAERLEAAGIGLHEVSQGQLSAPRFVSRLAALFRRLRPDVVHSQCQWSLPQQALCARAAGVPRFILTVHSLYPRRAPLTEWRRRLAARLAQPGITHWVAVSEAVRQHTCGLFGLAPARVKVIYNGVDTTRFCPPPAGDAGAGLRASLGVPADAFMILNVASLTPDKDHATLLQAMQLLQDRTAWLVLAGEGPLRPELEAAAQRLGVAGRVRFLGAQPDVAPLYQAADLFVLSSRREGLPLVALEAMAAQLPVVATRVGGLPELIRPDENGWLVPPGEPSAMRAAMQFVRSNPGQAARVAQAARQTVLQRFSRTSCLEQYRTLYAF